MNINWFTVIAQAINFIILVWLLKRYLYVPILEAVDEREKRIAAQLNDAADKEAKAKKEQEDFLQKNIIFDREVEAKRTAALTEVEAERQQLLENARNEHARLSLKLQESWNREQENLSLELTQKIQHEVFAIAQKTLSDLASLTLEEQIVTVFITRLAQQSKEDKQQLTNAFQNSPAPILVRCAFPLSETAQNNLKKAVQEILQAKAPLTFQTSPELVSGIEISANGYKLDWSIAAYLASVEKKVLQTSSNNIPDA